MGPTGPTGPIDAMVNKLRGLSIIGGGLVIALSAWGLAHYVPRGGEPIGFVKSVALGVLVLGLPRGLAHAKLWTRAAMQVRARRRSTGSERGMIFVSQEPIEHPDRTLDAIEAAVTEAEGFDDVYRDTFPEGEGLTVIHTGYHNSFVRVSRAAKLVVTGASVKSRDLARSIEDHLPLSLEPGLRNPFEKPRPVRGAPRVFLGVFLVVLVIAGVAGVATAAYPSDAYNPAEKTVLIGLDLRSDFDPAVTETDLRLDKAAFLVQVLDEEEVEILWEQNDSERILNHGMQAEAISGDVRAQLAAVRADDPTPAQAARADEIEAGLHEAELEVARALERRAAGGGLEETDLLFRARDNLRRAANTSVDADG